MLPVLRDRLDVGTPTVRRGLSAYSRRLLSLGPALYWTFDNRSGASDLSGNGRHGAVAGGVAVGANAGSPLVGGLTSTDFDGSNDRVASLYTVPWDSPAMVVMWVKPTDYLSTRTWFGTAIAANAPQLLATSASALLFRPVGGSATGQATITASLPTAGQWSMLAVGLDDANDLCYHSLNGAARATVAATATAGVAGALTTGASSGSFLGPIGPVAVFTRLLTDAELAFAYST